ncbi:MAG: hypothetical protein ACK46A_00490 [Akkermansiaceae bacterium]|jgi:hypothetical protein|nr:hypothetical protein [Luteolibacter sp.]
MQSKVSFDSNHLPGPTTEQTPLDQLIEMEIEAGIDTDEDGSDEDVLALKSIPPDALLVLLRFIISSTSKKKRWRVAQLKLCTLAHAAGMEGIGDKSLTELAEELGCTRALLSLYATRLADQLGISQVRGGKCRESRETYRKNALKSHQARGNTLSGKEKRARHFPHVE